MSGHSGVCNRELEGKYRFHTTKAKCDDADNCEWIYLSSCCKAPTTDDNWECAAAYFRKDPPSGSDSYSIRVKSRYGGDDCWEVVQEKGKPEYFQDVHSRCLPKGEWWAQHKECEKCNIKKDDRDVLTSEKHSQCHNWLICKYCPILKETGKDCTEFPNHTHTFRKIKWVHDEMAGYYKKAGIQLLVCKNAYK